MIFTVNKMTEKRCVYCGEDNEKVLEKHHDLGRKCSDQVSWVCLNCHKIITDDQNALPTRIRKSGKQHDMDLFALVSIAAYNFLMAKRLIEICKRLGSDKND
jgi:DNA-directed RNA polymerase subunit RPC12/RpoP